jgi:hypothetical protein
METIYFVLGMLSIIGVAFVATIVWGVVKISRLLKTIKQQEEWIINNERHIHDNIHRLREDLERRMDNMERHAYGHVTDLQREMELKTNSQITDAVTQSTSYTDKRIDKLVDTYLSDKKSKKELING